MRTTTRRSMIRGAVIGVLVSLAAATMAIAQSADPGVSGPGEGGEGFTAPGWRQQHGERLAQRGEGTGWEDRRERVQERVRLLRAWRLTEVLDLDETTATQLFELLDAHDEQVGQAETTLNEAARELQQLVEGGEGTGDGSDARISELLEQVMTAHLQIEALRAQLVRDAGAFLTPRQQAALMLFLPEFDREIRQTIQDVRRERRQGHREGRRGRRGATAPEGPMGPEGPEEGPPMEPGP